MQLLWIHNTNCSTQCKGCHTAEIFNYSSSSLADAELQFMQNVHESRFARDVRANYLKHHLAASDYHKSSWCHNCHGAMIILFSILFPWTPPLEFKQKPYKFKIASETRVPHLNALVGFKASVVPAALAFYPPSNTFKFFHHFQR